MNCPAANELAVEQCGASWYGGKLWLLNMETKFKNKPANARTAAASGALCAMKINPTFKNKSPIKSK